MVAYHQTGQDGREVTVRVRPNRRLSGTALAVVIALPATACLVIGLVALHSGFWPVLPFAGLEALAVGCGLTLAWQRSRDCDEITIAQPEVAIRRRRQGLWGEPRIREYRFPAPWVKVRLGQAAHRWHPRRLMLGAHGRSIEIGAFLNEREREDLATELRRLLAPTSAWSAGAALCPPLRSTES